jgi:Zn-dependent metalloprotease
MYTRTLTYMRPNTTVPFIRDALSADQMATYNQIIDARAKATGFQGETESISDDQMNEVFASVWTDEASYMAFYDANKALVDQHTADKLTYSGLQCVGYSDTRKTI